MKVLFHKFLLFLKSVCVFAQTVVVLHFKSDTDNNNKLID